MARNDGMDAMGALLGLGLLGTLAGDEPDNMPEFIKEMQRRQTASGKTPVKPEQKKATPADGAKAAYEIYYAYMDAGFSCEQAFELLKLTLTYKN